MTRVGISESFIFHRKLVRPTQPVFSPRVHFTKSVFRFCKFGAQERERALLFLAMLRERLHCSISKIPNIGVFQARICNEDRRSFSLAFPRYAKTPVRDLKNTNKQKCRRRRRRPMECRTADIRESSANA